MTSPESADELPLIAEGRRARRELPDAPEWLVLRAEALADARPVRAPAPTLRQRLQALLTLDSWAIGTPVPALRSGGAGARQLLFTVDGCDIDLRLAKSGAAWWLRGQVLGAEERGSVEISGPALATPQRQPIGELGDFDIGSLPPGDYTLALALADFDVDLPPLHLPGPADDA